MNPTVDAGIALALALLTSRTRRKLPASPEGMERLAVRTEIAAHNIAVDKRKAEKRRAKGKL